VIKGFYYNQITMKQISEKIGVTSAKASQLLAAALRKLRKSKYIMNYRVDIIYNYAFRSSLTSFRDIGMSSTERQ